ncbi:MAG: DUF7035 domain-containing protein [Verrucomicrobiota bacterium JB025]|nr:hypothetical protein [Verrucomicrobiota bacterium JB025]
MNPSPAIALAALLSLHVAAQDTLPPSISSISIVPTTVDVSSGPATLHVSIQLTDDDSGIQDGFINLYNPSNTNANWQHFDHNELTAGDNLDGTYEVDIAVPQYGEPGDWEVHVDLWDNSDNSSEFGGDGMPFPVPADALFTVVNTGPVDTSPPQATSIEVTPPSVDTSSTAQQITVTIAISDNLSGFRFGNIFLKAPSGTINYDLTEYFSSSNLVSGSPADGTYSVTLSLPAGSEMGTWNVEWYLRDETGNSEFSSSSTLPGSSFEVDLTSSGPPGGLPDAVDATHLTWTTTGDADWFIQGATTLDGIDAAQSGSIGDDMTTEMSVELDGPGTLSFWWKVQSEENWDELIVTGPNGWLDSISGDMDWNPMSIPIPAGTHTVTWSYQKDSGYAEGADAGWVERVTFRSDSSDIQDPVLQRIHISPQTVDLSTPFPELTITLEVSDDFNGIDGGTITLYDENDNPITDLYFSDSDLISGDTWFGVYELHHTFDPLDFDPVDGYLTVGTSRAEVEIDEYFGTSRYYASGSYPFPIPGEEFFTIAFDGSGGSDSLFLASVDQISPDPLVLDGADGTLTVEFTAGGGSAPLDYGLIYLYNADGGLVTTRSFTDTNLVTGTPYHGSYIVNLTIPAIAPPGTWRAVFWISNSNGDQRYYPYDEAFPNPGEEEFEVQNLGTTDTTAPTLTGFTLTPAMVDTSASAQTINVGVTASDDMAGIASISIWVHNPNYEYQPLVSGHISPPSPSLGGTFTTTLEIPSGSMEGDWICEVYLRDAVGNSAIYGDSAGPAFPVAGSNIFTVGASSSSTFENFISTYNLSGPDALPSGNPDGDWLANGFELLIGSHPGEPDQPNPALFMTARSGDRLRIQFTIDPSFSIQPVGDFLEVSDGGAPVRVSGQTSPGLGGSWSFVPPALISGTTYEVSVPIVPGSSAFLRAYMDSP